MESGSALWLQTLPRPLSQVISLYFRQASFSEKSVVMSTVLDVNFNILSGLLLNTMYQVEL